MTKSTISLLVQGSPFTSNACTQALEFAKATLRTGHVLFRVFFYKDAVLIANGCYKTPSDERNIQQDWKQFALETKTQLCVCVGACERRGIQGAKSSDWISEFEIVGLGQLTEAMFESDRLVSFH